MNRGTCYRLFAFDVGFSVDLELCAEILKEAAERSQLRRSQRAPVYFEYDPAPLRLSQLGGELSFSSTRSAPHVDLTLFDFGVVTIVYTLPFSGAFSEIRKLSVELYDSQLLIEDAERRLELLINDVRPAISRVKVQSTFEEYTIFQFESLGESTSPAALVNAHGLEFAQILRSEDETLSQDEVREALSHQTSYTASDSVIVDWNAAILIGSSGEDVRAVLEFVNAELLQMRVLDEQLDDDLDESYRALQRNRNLRESLHRVGQLKVDSAYLFEATNNALKLLGDQYLARVYSLASNRFHLPEWDASILRKLSTLESIYQQMSNRASERRSEFLEWIVIILISVEVGFSLWGFAH